MNFKLFTLYLAFILLSVFTACKKTSGQTTAMSDTSDTTDQSENTTDQKIDSAFFAGKVKNSNIKPFTTTEKAHYSVSRFIKAHKKANIYLLDSVEIYANIKSYLIGDKKDNTVWFVNYNSRMEYIDSRWITKTNRWGNCELYSIIDKPGKKISSYVAETFTENSHIYTIINSDGLMEDMPDETYVEDRATNAWSSDSIQLYTNKEIAFSGCMGLAEKFYLNTEWTAVDFSRSLVKQIKTTRNYIDHLDQTITLYETISGENEEFYPVVAFRGKHKIELISLDTLHNDKEYTDSLTLEISKELASDETLFPENKEDLTSTTSNIKCVITYSPDNDKENRYTFVLFSVERLYSYNTSAIPYESLVVIKPSGEIQVLAYYCVYDFYIFKKEDISYLYTCSTSCGEGAYGVDYIFRIGNTEIQKIEEYAMGCD